MRANKRQICTCEKPIPRYQSSRRARFFECKLCGGIREQEPPLLETPPEDHQDDLQSVSPSPLMSWEGEGLEIDPDEREGQMPLCQCGCQRPVRISQKTGLPNKFLRGHASKVRVEVLCDCGCGAPVHYSEALEDWPRFLPGHSALNGWRRKLKRGREEKAGPSNC